MNNKKNINVNYIKVCNNDQSSLNELKKINKNEETFNVLNMGKYYNKNIYQCTPKKDNKLVNSSVDEKNNFYIYYGDWGWGLGIGDWGLGIGPNPQ